MAEGVNFNPFMGKGLTIDQIMEKLDTDKDGKISDAEYQTGLSWVSGGPDDEGDVVIGDENKASTTSELDTSGKKLYGAAQKNGVKDTASSQDEIKDYLNTIQDEYIQQYMQDNPGMTSAEKSSFVTYIKSQGTEFINQFLQKNAKAATFDTQSIAAELINKLDSAVETRKATQEAVNEKIEGYKNSTDTNFKNLAEYTDKADDDYVTSKEFTEMKKEAVNYLMGAIINGSEAAEFMKKFDVDYKNNGNYQDALKAINDLKACSDPAKMQELIEKAETALSNFLGKQNVDGTSKLNDAIVTKDQADKDAKAAAQKTAYKEQLSSINDKMLEDMSNQLTTTTRRTGLFRRNTVTTVSATYTEDQMALYTQKLDNILNKFISEYEGDGKNIETEYSAFVQKVMSEQDAVNSEIDTLPTKKDPMSGLSNAVNSAGTYVSAEEKAKIMNEAQKYVLAEMVMGQVDDSALGEMYPNYKTDENYINAKELYDGLATSATPKEDFAKIKELINKMLETTGIDNITKGVKRENAKNINLQPGNLTSGIWGYNSNDTHGGDQDIRTTFRIGDDGKIVWTNDLDRADIEKALNQLKERMKTQLKEQLGDLYNEDNIDQYFDKAVLSSVMNMGDPNNLIKVSTLINKVISEFNTIATDGLKGNKTNSIDKTQVMKDAGVIEDYSTGRVSGSHYAKHTKAKDSAKNKAQAKLQALKSSLISQAKSLLGDKFNSSDIETLIDQTVKSTVDGYDYSRTGTIFSTHYSFNTSVLYDQFFNNFDNALNKYKQKNGIN